MTSPLTHQCGIQINHNTYKAQQCSSLHINSLHLTNNQSSLVNINRVLTDVLHDRVSVVVKIEDMIIQSHLQWHCHAMHRDISTQICEIVEVKITGKSKKGLNKEIEGIVHKEGFGTIWLEKRGCVRSKKRKKWGE